MAFPTTPTDGQEYRKWIYVASLGAWRKKGDTPIGTLFAEPGEVTSPSADFPNLCATNFTGAQTVPAELPYLTMKLRQKRLSLDGTFDFSGSASGSDITLDSNTTNQDLMAALAEWRLDFATYTDWLTVTWSGVEYPITNIDAGTLVISVTGTPAAGAGTASFYPHRIAGSSNARIHSLSGKTLMGAGTSEVLSMGHRRDRMQQITGESGNVRNETATGTGVFDLSSSGAITSIVSSTTNITSAAVAGGNNGYDTKVRFDSADSPNARTSPATDTEGATHGPDIGANLYYVGGPYVAA